MRATLGRGLDAELPDPLAAPTGAVPWELAVLALVVGANLVQNLAVPSGWHVLSGPLLALAAVGLARRAGASWALLGLSPAFVRRGLRVGAVAFAVVAIVVVLAAVVPGLSGAFADDRVVHSSTGRVLYEALVRVPVATVLTEEVLFRGVGYGLLARRLGALRGMVVASLLFGCWHVLPTLASREDNPVTDDAAGALAVAGVVLGAVLATTLAGLAFTWLRRRSGSVAAPWLAHVATNSVTLLAALVLSR